MVVRAVIEQEPIEKFCCTLEKSNFAIYRLGIIGTTKK